MHQLLYIPHTAYATPFTPFSPQPTPTGGLGDTMTVGGGEAGDPEPGTYTHTHRTWMHTTCTNMYKYV